MKLGEIITRKSNSEVIALAKKAATGANLQWSTGIEVLLTALVAHPIQTPSVKDTKAERGELVVLRKWLAKYWKGYEGRPSVRTSNLSKTIPDPILGHLVSTRLPKLTKSDLELVEYAHRLEMGAENINGLLLEEYLALELAEFGWHCAWGETVKAVDFVNIDGRLLQVKNRDNSENSSSSLVRQGTVIDKWYRIRSTKVEYKWEALNEMNATTKFDEPKYLAFAQQCLKNNPNCIALDPGNPWGDTLFDVQ